MKKFNILLMTFLLFSLASCMSGTQEMTDTTNFSTQTTNNPSTSELDGTENSVDITSVINYLSTKEFYPENLRNKEEMSSTYVGLELSSALSIGQNAPMLLSDTSKRIYPEDIYLGTAFYSKRTREFNMIYVQTETFKEELQNVLPYVDKFGEFIKLDDQDFYFKIVLEGESIEDGINYYSVDINNLVYVYMHNYFIEEEEYLELSISRPAQALNACETCMETYTYYNYNDTELKLIEMVEFEYWDILDGFEDVYLGKYINPSIFEYKLLDNGSYETTYMFAGYSAEMDENYRIIPSTFKRDGFSIETYREFEDGSAISVMQTNGNSREDVYMIYYENIYKPYLFVNLPIHDGNLLNISFHPFILDKIEYLDCDVAMEDGVEIYTINNIVTETYTLYFNDIKPTTADYDGSGYQISIGSQHFGGIEGMLSALREYDTAVDFDWLYAYSSIFYEEYCSASVLGMDIFSMSVDTWEKYLDINFFVNYDAFFNQFNQFDVAKDYIPPIIYAPEVIEINDYEDIDTFDFSTIVAVFDDIDGPIPFSSIEFEIHHEDDIITYILLTVEDEAGNTTNHLILVNIAEETGDVVE